MPKFAPDALMDAGLDYVALATVMHVCSTLDATPTYAEVIAASLADVTVAPGDFTKADGDTSGRKVTVAAKSAVPVDVGGTPNHIALVTTSGSVLRYVTTCTGPTLTPGSTVNIPAWNVTLPDPT